MTHVTFIEHDGATHTVEAADGTSLMQAALDNLIPGIIGDCGGSCNCATCHCYIDAAHLAQLPAPSIEEQAVLEGLLNTEPGSRLCCQIKLSPALVGLVARLPASQLY